MTRDERVLAIVLRVLSVPLLLAFPCALLPFNWMDATHRWLDLGELPAKPILIYLARSCSLFYGMHGAMLLFLSFGVRQHLRVISFLSCLGVAFGAALVAVDLSAGLPGYWTAMEGPIVAIEGGLFWWLARRAAVSAAQGQPPSRVA